MDETYPNFYIHRFQKKCTVCNIIGNAKFLMPIDPVIPKIQILLWDQLRLNFKYFIVHFLGK